MNGGGKRSADPSRKPPGVRTGLGQFYGSFIAPTAVVIFFLTNGATVIVPPVFFPQFIEEFQSTEQAVTLCGAITLLLAGILAPLAGIMIDRFGVRRLMRAGILLLGGSVILYTQVGAVWHLYVLHMLFAAGLTLCGLLINVVLLSNWFVRRRGAVIGMLVTGSSLAGAVLPNILSPVISSPHYGWRWAYGLMAALVCVIGVPLVFFVIKEHPRDVGQHPDGDSPTTDPVIPVADITDEPQGVTLREAIRTRVLWFLSIGSAFLWFAIFAVQNQLVIYLKRDLGLSQERAAFFLSVVFMASIAGKFGFGTLSDYFTKRSIMMLTSSLLFLGGALFFDIDTSVSGIPLGLVENQTQITAFALLFGLGYGGTFSMIQLMVPECFGPRELGRILGVVTLIDTFGAFAGITLTGILRTHTGSYLIPFLAVVFVSFLGMINVWLVRPLPYDRRTSAHRELIQG